MTPEEIKTQFNELREQLCTSAEAALAFNVTPVCISQWIARYDDFPKKLALTEKQGLFVKSELIDWYLKRERTQWKRTRNAKPSPESILRTVAMMEELEEARSKQHDHS